MPRGNNSSLSYVFFFFIIASTIETGGRAPLTTDISDNLVSNSAFCSRMLTKHVITVMAERFRHSHAE
jgi:hypothetical protein